MMTRARSYGTWSASENMAQPKLKLLQRLMIYDLTYYASFTQLATKFHDVTVKDCEATNIGLKSGTMRRLACGWKLKFSCHVTCLIQKHE
jgi:hypothetical protein